MNIIKDLLRMNHKGIQSSLTLMGAKRIRVVSFIIWMVGLYGVISDLIAPPSVETASYIMIANTLLIAFSVTAFVILLKPIRDHRFAKWFQITYYYLILLTAVFLDLINNRERILGISTRIYDPSFIVFALISIFPIFQLKEVFAVTFIPFLFLILGIFTPYYFSLETVLTAILYTVIALSISQMIYRSNYHNLEQAESLKHLNKELENLAYSDPQTHFYSQWGMIHLFETPMNHHNVYTVILLELEDLAEKTIYLSVKEKTYIYHKLDKWIRALAYPTVYIGHWFENQLILMIEGVKDEKEMLKHVTLSYDKTPLKTYEKPKLHVVTRTIQPENWRKEIASMTKEIERLKYRNNA